MQQVALKEVRLQKIQIETVLKEILLLLKKDNLQVLIVEIILLLQTLQEVLLQKKILIDKQQVLDLHQKHQEDKTNLQLTKKATYWVAFFRLNNFKKKPFSIKTKRFFQTN